MSTSPDFASDAMVRALAQGMLALGLTPPPEAAGPARATVPLDLKRALVQSAIAQGGIACLPLLGRGLHALAMEPTHLALTAARDGAGLLVRWQRLERYIHSRHRIRVIRSGPGEAVVEHHALEGPPPLAVEDLVVCGVLCALLEANGLAPVSAHVGTCALYPQPEAPALAARVAAGDTATWHLRWRPADPQPAADREAWAEVAPTTWSPWARDLGARVAQALPSVPRMADAAHDLGMAPRSFQRALAAQGLTFRALVSEVRFRLAGWYLLRSATPLAETGFVCGYTDQAHLTREFQRRVGVTPARYRSLFAKA